MWPTRAVISQVEVSGVQNRIQHGLKQQEVTLKREEVHIITMASSGASLLDEGQRQRCAFES